MGRKRTFKRGSWMSALPPLSGCAQRQNCVALGISSITAAELDIDRAIITSLSGDAV